MDPTESQDDKIHIKGTLMQYPLKYSKINKYKE